MPRGSSASSRSYSSPRRSFSSRRSYSSPKIIPIPPQTTSIVQTPTSIQQHMQHEKPGFFSNMWQGFGLGAGQAIAHNIFRSNPVVNHVHHEDAKQKNDSIKACLPKEFVQCMKDNNNDKDLCKHFLDSYFTTSCTDHLNNNI